MIELEENVSSCMVLSGIRLRKINDVLNSCVQGQRILQAYKREKELNEKWRNKMSNNSHRL